jgi:hypothetical protein
MVVRVKDHNLPLPKLPLRIVTSADLDKLDGHLRLHQTSARLLRRHQHADFSDALIHAIVGKGRRLRAARQASTSWPIDHEAGRQLSTSSVIHRASSDLGRELGPPPGRLVVRPAPADRLLRPQTQAARIAETWFDHIGHPEVVRSLEHLA